MCDSGEEDLREFSDDQLWAEAVSPDAERRVEALTVLAERAVDAREYDTALGVVSAALDAAQATASPMLIGDAISFRAGVLWDLGRHDESMTGYLEAVDVYEAAELFAPAGLGYLRLASSALDAGMLDAVMPRVRQAIDSYALGGDLWNVLPHALVNISSRLSQVGRLDDALSITRAARDISVEADAWHAISHVALHETELLGELGEIDAALDVVHGAQAQALERGEERDFALLASVEADVLIAGERLHEARMLIAAVLEERAEVIDPMLCADLIAHDARAMWAADEDEAALQRLGEAQAIIMHWGEALVFGDQRATRFDTMRAEWLAYLERWEESAAVFRRLLRVAEDDMRLKLATSLAHCIAECHQPDEALAVLDSTPESDATTAVGSTVWMWRQSIRAHSLGELGRWDEVEALAAAALEAVAEGADRVFVAHLWECRGLAALDHDLDASQVMFERACVTYREIGEASSVDEMVEQMQCLAVLANSRWDRTATSAVEGGAQ